MRPTLILATLLAVASPGLPLQAQEATAAENAPAASAPALPAITVTTVDLIQLSDRVIASGLVAAVEEVQVAPLVEGQPLDQLLADVGDMVVEGQVLAVLSKTTLELQKAKTARDEAQRVADRTATLRAQGTAPQAQADTATANALSANARVAVATQGLESARAQLALAQARLENVDLMLSRTEVKAPVAGRIVERNAKIGAIATAAGQPMFVITRDGALELRADVSEADILRLAPGQKVQLRAVGLGDALQGTVRLIEPSIDPVTRLGRARISLDQAGALRTGMYVEAEILAAQRDALAIPITAIGSGPDGSTVLRVADGVVERVVVTTGIRDGGLVEITSGLARGDQVVLKAGAFVRAGDRINPVAAAGTTN
ncbi:MAG: efflux transporter periplasmic adaptor subunit [Rhodobacterales bacterium 32-66-9]|nr:MAG: efflux transporter periplasmic adaptor subunit [Rhodobacterales bacterium 32-66-9]